MILAPLGEGNYIWPSVSPDGTKLLFTRAGKGTYFYDLQGNILANLGHANAPQWSPDGKWILFMKDYDNGTDVKSSDIFAYNLLNSQTTQLSDTKDIHEMYPQWSSDGQKVIFNSADGKIFLMELKAE
jgi:Tol biopolymer transport system component